MAALTKAIVPLMIKMVLRIPSIIALPIPRVKTPKRIFPVTLAAVIATS
jgi:hypothetical protein